MMDGGRLACVCVVMNRRPGLGTVGFGCTAEIAIWGRSSEARQAAGSSPALVWFNGGCRQAMEDRTESSSKQAGRRSREGPKGACLPRFSIPYIVHTVVLL